MNFCFWFSWGQRAYTYHCNINWIQLSQDDKCSTHAHGKWPCKLSLYWSKVFNKLTVCDTDAGMLACVYTATHVCICVHSVSHILEYMCTHMYALVYIKSTHYMDQYTYTLHVFLLGILTIHQYRLEYSSKSWFCFIRLLVLCRMVLPRF